MKKREHRPVDWGKLTLTSPEDVKHVPTLKDLHLPASHVRVILWKTRKHMQRSKRRPSKAGGAFFFAYHKPETDGGESLLVGDLNFHVGQSDESTILHEVAHASHHAERFLATKRFVRKAKKVRSRKQRRS